jgi:hypothetical protein
MTTTRKGLDLRPYSLGSMGPSGIYAAAFKRDAQAEAVARGWGRRSVALAFNRFGCFYVLAQCIGSDDQGVDLMELAGKTRGAENVVRIARV